MKLIKYIKQYSFQAIAGFFFKILEAFLELLVPIVVASIIDVGVASKDLNFIYTRGLMLVGLAVCGYLSALVCQWYASKVSQLVGTTLRKDMYEKINNMDDKTITRLTPSSLATRLVNDVVQIQQAIAMTIRLTSRAPFIMIGSLVMAFLISGKMVIIFIVGTIILAIGMTFITVVSMPYFARIQKTLDKIALKTRETLNGIRVIRAFSNTKKEISGFKKTTKSQKDIQVKVGKFQALLNPFTFLIVNITIVVILYVGGIEVNIGGLSQGEVLALTNYMNSILQVLIVYANVLSIYNKCGASYSRIVEVLEDQPSIEDKGTNKEMKDVNPIIKFDNVSLAYDKHNILEDISFEINKGETVGIIGGTGAGKTSLVNLIMRYYEVSSGVIKLCNQPINSYSLNTLRSNIGLVNQNPSLFTGTIKENLLMGQDNNTSLDEALKVSQSDEFVKQSGIDRMLVEGGKNLSGGQKQRLTIARALVKNPSILIMDDSSSALDYATERSLFNELDKLTNMTKLVISQRISSIRSANKILVLYHGKMVGFDTHDNLLKTCNVYKEIVDSQTSKVGDNYEK